MSRIKLSAPVRITDTGEITTIAALATAGRVRFTKSDNWRGDRGKAPRIAYFAELIPEMNGGIEGCWEISIYVYTSRSGSEV